MRSERSWTTHADKLDATIIPAVATIIAIREILTVLIVITRWLLPVAHGGNRRDDVILAQQNGAALFAQWFNYDTRMPCMSVDSIQKPGGLKRSVTRRMSSQANKHSLEYAYGYSDLRELRAVQAGDVAVWRMMFAEILPSIGSLLSSSIGALPL